jgi:hypothetical protein
MRYRGRRAASMIDWSTIDYVVGTRADVTRTGIKRPCSRCGEDVYTSRRYPQKVAMVCEYCALAIAEEEAATEQLGPFVQPALPAPRLAPATPAAPPGPLLDPWQRTLQAQTRSARRAQGAPGRRRLRPRPDAAPDA